MHPKILLQGGLNVEHFRLYVQDLVRMKWTNIIVCINNMFLSFYSHVHVILRCYPTSLGKKQIYFCIITADLFWLRALSTRTWSWLFASSERNISYSGDNISRGCTGIQNKTHDIRIQGASFLSSIYFASIFLQDCK